MDSRHMLEGVLWMADKTVADVMVAAPKMDLIDIQAPQDELFDFVIDKAHSRFPVFEAEKENIIEAVKSGVSNYVVKPFSPAMFQEKLALVYKKHFK